MKHQRAWKYSNWKYKHIDMFQVVMCTHTKSSMFFCKFWKELEQIGYTYAREADLLNVALFGKTAKQWRTGNPDKKGNIRDHATLNQLLVLANMESYNAILIEQGKEQSERLILLRELAMRQMQTMESVNTSRLPQGGTVK